MSPSPDAGWAAIFGGIGAAITGAFAWLVQKSKGHSDVEVAVLAEWSKLNTAWSEAKAAVEQEFTEYRKTVAAEFEKLRTEHAAEVESIRREHSQEFDELRRKHREEMREQRLLNEGLQRMIAQNSQSTAHLIGDVDRGDDG